MISSKVARRYARALLGLASDHAQLEAWGVELDQLARILEAPEIAAGLDSPELAATARIAAVSKIAEKLGLSFPMRSFAVVVARHGRVREAGAIAAAYARMLDARLGRARATLTFAQAPADGELQTLVRGLEAIAQKRVIPTVKVAPSLIGGVIVELEGKTYDGSLATRLAEAERRLSA